MRKKLALLLAGVMVAAVIPVTSAFAGTTTYVDKVETVQKGKVTTNNLVIKDGNNDINDAAEAQLFTLKLEGAEWDGVAGTYDGAVVTELSSTIAEVSIPNGLGAGKVFRIPLKTITKSKGEATVTLDSKKSVVTGGTFTYAVVITGTATAKIDGTVDIPEDGAAIKNITISETAPGSLDAGELKLKVSKGFKLAYPADFKLIPVGGGDGAITEVDRGAKEYKLNVAKSTAKAMEYIVSKLRVVPDDAKPGAVAEITVSGAGMTTVTFEVGTYIDYGVKVKLYDEDKEAPTFYSGKVYTKNDQKTLAVTISEAVAHSINNGRKLTFTFPEGVKVVTAYTGGAGVGGSGVIAAEQADSDAWDNAVVPVIGDITIKNNEVTIKNIDCDNTKLSKMTFAFNLVIGPEFTGDVDVTVGGAAIGVEETLTVAKVVAPFTVEADINEVAIDYRNVAVSDIVIKEAKAGAFKENEKVAFQVENMHFEKGTKFEVTAGDLEIKDLKVTTNGQITFVIKSESAKAAGEITLSGIQLYLGRSLPAGDYDLVAKTKLGSGDFFPACQVFKNADGDLYFDVEDVTMVKSYVKVVTAGRDVDDSTFTTKIVVPVGEKTIKAGEKEIAIDVPAFINADGYTMMPLRAVVEALSGAAIVTWDGETKTATVLFGARVISMTIGQKSMKINGVDVAMLAAPVIVESRTFLPLRDLGYALGLNESQVNWDSETKTATLN